jgi:hypothetical protein
MSDPIIEELHQIREDLMSECGGDIKKFSVEAKEDALALGFKYSDLKPQFNKLVLGNIATA